MSAETEAGILILGSGSSTGVPRPSCLFEGAEECKVCLSAVAAPPEQSPNYRNNPSIAIRHYVDGQPYSVLIDCGKTFREGIIRWFPSSGFSTVDAVVLTHHHADAVFGLDDLRGLEPKVVDSNKVRPVTVYANEETMECMANVFPYLMTKPAEGKEIRRVAAIAWETIDESPFVAGGLSMTPLPVQHGEDLICFGYMFGTTDVVVYLSDVSRIPDEIMDMLEKTDIFLLIVDCLFKARKHNTHFNLEQSLDAVRKLRPQRALLVGMSDEFDYESDNAELAELRDSEGLDVQLARDGLFIPCRL